MPEHKGFYVRDPPIPTYGPGSLSVKGDWECGLCIWGLFRTVSSVCWIIWCQWHTNSQWLKDNWSRVLQTAHFQLLVLSFSKFTQKWSGWISDSCCSLNPLWSGMGEVVLVPCRPYIPHHLPLCCNYPVLKVSHCINCQDYHFKRYRYLLKSPDISLYLPPGRRHLQQPATIDPTLDLCTRYPLRLGGPRQCGIWSLPNTSTHGQHWESNPRPSDLGSNVLSTATCSHRVNT